MQGFRTENDSSYDTKFVDGVDSGIMAKAATVNIGGIEELVHDKETVAKALTLYQQLEDGTELFVNASDILTEEEGRSLKEAALLSSNRTSEDMRSLRNEMYHLKSDMIRNGAMNFDQVYDGYIDPFMDGNDLYVKTTMAES